MLLSDTQIKKAKIENKSYRLKDGQGLFILVHPNGSKYWRFRYTFGHKENTLSFGTYPHLSLAEARKRRDEAKVFLAKNINPSEHKKLEKKKAESDLSFKGIATLWGDSHKNWSRSHHDKVMRTLEMHTYPSIGQRPVHELTTRELSLLLKRVESTGKAEVALRIQQRVASIMRYAVQHGYIDYNPAQDLSGVVSPAKATHRAALSFEKIPELLNRLDHYKGREFTQLVIKLTLLTFIRSSEMRFARWSEIDFQRKVWTLPATRELIEGVRYSDRGAKMKSTHLVPLSEQAIQALKALYDITGQSSLICASDKRLTKPMSDNTVNKALKVMGYNTTHDVCGHGFRAMACSALVESGLWSKDAIERQMSHQERNSVRAAYIHMAQHLEERTQMMQWWANYLDAIQINFVMPYEFK